MEKNKIKVLAVDDNSDNLISLKALIKESFPDSIIYSAESGTEGIKLAEAEDPDVILLDVIMPGMDGFETCQKLKISSKTRDIPVIFLTALKADKESRIRALEVGADAFLTKPIDETELTAQIRAMQKIKNASNQKQKEKDYLARLVSEQTRELEQAHLATLNLLEELRNENEARKRNEIALRKNEEHFRLAQEAANSGTWEWDLSTNKNTWSENLWHLYGLEPHSCEPSFNAWLLSIHPDDRSRVAQIVQETAAKELELSVEWRVNFQDGRERWLMSRGRPFRNADGQVTHYAGVVIDDTSHIQIENTLMFLAQHSWLTSGENFFQSLARFLAEKLKMDYVCIDRLEGDGRAAQTVAIFFDGQFEDNVSYTLKDTPCGDVVGKTICCFPNQVRYLFPNDIVLQEMLAESYVGTTLWSADGQAIGLIAIISRRPLDNPQLAETMLKLVAVRAAGELERQQKEKELLREKASLAQKVEERTADLRLANTELLRAARIKDEFLASMSHELRTPLTGILGLSEALQLNIYGEMNQKQNDAIQNIQKSGKHLLTLINDILDLSKIDAGMIKLESRPVSVQGVCQSSIQMIRQAARERQMIVNLNIEDGVEYFETDERRLKQILVNLLSNAVKFSPKGSAVGLDVRGDIDNKRILFTVWDNGIGIPAQDLNRLFRPFTQLDSALSRQYPGTGLGLSLVLKIVELFGGGIQVESEPGRGSRFMVTLPWLRVRPSDTNETAPLPRSIVETKTNNINPLILVVEDNQLYLDLLTDILSISGYRVVTALNGEEGISQARESQPDLILMDIQMPVLDGFQAARRIRSDPNLKTTPIIALTALAMSGDREKCFEAGMNDYLSKPVNIEDLKKAINSLINDLRPITL